MHDGGWFGMGLYWQIPLVIVVVGVLASLLFRGRSRG